MKAINEADNLFEEEDVIPQSFHVTVKQNNRLSSLSPYRHFTLKQALTHATFWYIFFMLLFSMTFSSFIKPEMKNFGSSKFNNDLYLTMIGIVAYATSTVSKFAMGIF